MAYEVVWRELVGSQPGPRLLVTGGVHGDEFEPMAAARRLLTEIPRESLRGKLTVAPVVNEPAFRRGLRTAEDGLDLARTCPGRADGSITEQVAHSLASLIRSADFYIDLHTGGTRLRVLPLAGYMLHPDAEILDTQRRMARAFGLPLIWGSDWRLEGRSLSVARDARVPAIYCEYQGGGDCDPRGIDAYVAGCRSVMAALGMLDGTVLEPPDGLVFAEDDRPGAGHMQVNLPAPREGFFEPAVELGERVRQGQTIGFVCDVLGDDRRLVTAPHDGLVIVLHSFRRVEEGESLGVVLETAT
jgi:predicted deacylase